MLPRSFTRDDGEKNKQMQILRVAQNDRFDGMGDDFPPIA